jgi:hypothetical protein
MIATTPTPSPRLHALLLDYLRSPDVSFWPGADGVTLEEVVASYPLVAAAHQVPPPEELLTRHPDLAGELQAFFTPAAPTTS